MFVEVFKNHGINYIRLVQGVNGYSKNGKKTVLKKCILNVGPLSKYDDGKPDYVKRLKESFKNGNPLIPSLNEFVERKDPIKKYNISFKDGDPFCIGHSKLYSNALIERILEDLEVISWTARYKQFTGYEFDLVDFIRVLIYGRILNPASKIATVNQRNDYYCELLKDCYEYNVYDTLDFIYNYKSSLLNKINKNMKERFNRTTNIIYYDVTNFFFEIEHPDEDIIDENDELIEKGTRKNGVSKEHQPLPIVQMGLFMDEQGTPISIEIFPGNTLDHQTVKQSLNNTIDTLNIGRYIFVGDRGMYNGDNAFYIQNRNNGYVISKSILKTKDKERKWIYEDKDWVVEKNGFKHKSRNVKRKVKTSEGKYEYITEKVVVYFSESFYKKQIAENKSFLKFLEKFEKNPASFRLSKTQSKSLMKFLKDEVENKNTGEILDSNELKMLIDFDKVNKYKEQFGYYQIVSSELNMSDLEIINTYRGLTRIEDQFRVMKGDLNTRPLHVRTKEHIEAHLIICMIALLIIRIIQNKIVNKQGIKNKDKQWEMGLSGERVIKALKKWTVSELNDEYYRFNDIDDKDLKLILDAFNINIPLKLFKKNELRTFKTTIKVTD